MNRFLVKYPKLLQILYPKRISRIDDSKSIYLSFDDGPIPEITPWVLNTLKKYDAKATFFCIGDNVAKHPEVFQEILKEGHSIGNHTFNHLNGWKNSLENYVDNTTKAEAIIQSNILGATSTKLFRPPYGKIKNSQAKAISKLGYKIVMWDVLSGDYDQRLSPEACCRNVIENTTAGSIIVFHDSIKASKNLKIVLPLVLKYFSEKGMKFKSI